MNNNKDNICGIRIKALRKKNKLTQNQLSGLLHMSRSTVLKYETGRQIPPVDRICDIADIFDVSTDYLYGVSDCSLPLSKLNEIFYEDMTYAQLISTLLNLPEEHQKVFKIIVECLSKEQFCKSKWNASFKCTQIAHSDFSCSRWCRFLFWPPMPSKMAHKSPIGFLLLCLQETKKDSIPVFSHYVKTTKPESVNHIIWTWQLNSSMIKHKREILNQKIAAPP